MAKEKKIPKRPKSQFQGFLENTEDFFKEVNKSVNKVIPLSDKPNRADERALKRADERALGQSNGHFSGQSNGHFSGQSNGHFSGQSKEHSNKQSEGRSKGHSDRLSPSHPFFWITEKQSMVLLFLIQEKSRITRLHDISKATGVPYGTIRKSIDTLVREKCISKPSRYRKGQFQGFSYTVNEEVCKQFKEWNRNEHSDGQCDGHSDEHYDKRADCIAVKGTDNYSSSSSSSTKTTTLRIDEIVNNHPEFGYWRQKGLTVKQIEFWIKTIGCSPESIIKSLSHCRYEMVDKGLEESKPIKNVFNWFYRIVEKTGYYPAPKDYKSFEQKQIEREREFIEEQEKKIQELKKIHQKKWEQEQELEFWKMINEPEGELYKQCYEQLSSFEKELKTSKVFETVMRNAFDKVMLERDQSRLSEDGKRI
jgi:hypothetical protein